MHISDLPEDVILHLLQYLQATDTIALASTCNSFRQMCMDARSFRKMDLSSRCILTTETMTNFFRDNDMLQHVRELNLNDQSAINWQMDIVIQEFIMAICPRLEALHVLHCGMSFQMLHCILRQARKLTSLSWSLMDLTREDTDFMVSSDAIPLGNIRSLRLEILQCREHIRMLQYLVLSCCHRLEDLKVYMWHGYWPEAECDWMHTSFPQLSSAVTDELRLLHSFTMHIVCDQPYPCGLRCLDMEPELSEFICALVRKKPRETKWKKFWVSAPVDIRVLQAKSGLISLAVPLSDVRPDEFRAVEEFAAHVQKWELDEPKTLFQSVGDGTVKNLHLCALDYHRESGLIFELCDHIQRSGGNALKNLSLCVNPAHLMDVPASRAFGTLFAACSNVRELDLLGCHFEESICAPLSKLKQLRKIQIPHCAILSEQGEDHLTSEKAHTDLSTFVESCQNITGLDVRRCPVTHANGFSCCLLSDDDQVALAKLTKLRSLTLFDICDTSECAFLKSILEECKLLTMLRILTLTYDEESYFAVLQSARFLKHLAIDASLDLGSKVFWELLSCASKLERLCITTDHMGSLNVPAAVEMLKRLPRLHVLHLHCAKVKNFEAFRDHIISTVEAEESGRSFGFEFVIQQSDPSGTPPGYWAYCNRVLPVNRAELCLMAPRLTIPTS